MYNNSYPIKHWLATLVLGLLFLFGHDWIVNRTFDEITVALILLFSFLLSLPSVGVYYFVFVLLENKYQSAFKIKMILNGLAILGIFMTLMLIDESLLKEMFPAYSVATLISSLFFKIKNKT